MHRSRPLLSFLLGDITSAGPVISDVGLSLKKMFIHNITTDLKIIFNKSSYAYIYFDDLNGSANIWKEKDNKLIQISGFSDEIFLTVTQIAKKQTWIHIGNSTYKENNNKFYECLYQFLLEIQAHFNTNNILVNNDNRY